MQHGHIEALDPPGRSNRRWKCRGCGAEGTTAELETSLCTAAKTAPFTAAEQLTKWVAGESVHNNQGECCPDFSCCAPKLLWAVEQRQTFVDHPEMQDAMLMMSLAAALEEMAPEKKFHIAGFEQD